MLVRLISRRRESRSVASRQRNGYARRRTEQHQRRLQTFCTERRDCVKTVKDTLRGVGHCIRVEQ